MDRTGAQLLRDYMRDIVRRQTEAEEHGTWFREQVRAGLDSANAGNLPSYAGRQVALYIRDHGEEAQRNILYEYLSSRRSYSRGRKNFEYPSPHFSPRLTF